MERPLTTAPSSLNLDFKFKLVGAKPALGPCVSHPIPIKYGLNLAQAQLSLFTQSSLTIIKIDEMIANYEQTGYGLIFLFFFFN